MSTKGRSKSEHWFSKITSEQNSLLYPITFTIGILSIVNLSVLVTHQKQNSLILQIRRTAASIIWWMRIRAYRNPKLRPNWLAAHSLYWHKFLRYSIYTVRLHAFVAAIRSNIPKRFANNNSHNWQQIPIRFWNCACS